MITTKRFVMRVLVVATAIVAALFARKKWVKRQIDEDEAIIVGGTTANNNHHGEDFYNSIVSSSSKNHTTAGDDATAAATARDSFYNTIMAKGKNKNNNNNGTSSSSSSSPDPPLNPKEEEELSSNNKKKGNVRVRSPTSSSPPGSVAEGNHAAIASSSPAAAVQQQQPVPVPLPLPLPASSSSAHEATSSSSLSHHHEDGEEVPPISSLVTKGNKVVGDISFLLDFAIIGFPKCGTSSLLDWLNDHPEVDMAPGEMYHLNRGEMRLFAEEFSQYQLLDRREEQFGNHPAVAVKKHGYKNPVELYYGTGMRMLETYLPATKKVIAIRHPILWFQSFYNFRVEVAFQEAKRKQEEEAAAGKNNNKKMKMMNITSYHQDFLPRDEQSLRALDCYKGMGVCIAHAQFHLYLYLLGKTPGTPREVELLGRAPLHDDDHDDHGHNNNGVVTRTQPSTKNDNNDARDIFLMDVSQLSDPRLANDLGNFLGLKAPFVQGERDNVGHVHKFDICKARYDRLRADLLEIAVNASQWIRTYFLPNAPGLVVVSNRQYLEQEILAKQWTTDPCLAKRQQQKQKQP